MGEDTYAIVRAARAPQRPRGRGAHARRRAAARRLEEIVVAASRYSLSADVPDAHTLLTQEEIEGLPRFADDSLKAVHRLPGAASNGLSGLANIRGGEANETLVVFDGLPLYDPFHLRLLLSPASLLDPRILSGLDVHAGGFTARVRRPHERGHRRDLAAARGGPPTTSSVSACSTPTRSPRSASPTAGASGSPPSAAATSTRSPTSSTPRSASRATADGFGRVDYEFSPQTRGSLHVLMSSDQRGGAQCRRDRVRGGRLPQFLFLGDARARLLGRHSADARSFRTRTSPPTAQGEVDEAGQRVGTVDDERHYDVLGLKLDGRYRSERWLHRFGLELRSLSADVRLPERGAIRAGLPLPAEPAAAGRPYRPSTRTRPGSHVAAYATSRVLATERLAAELGLRWDDADLCRDRRRRPVEPANQPALPGWRHHSPARELGTLPQFQGINELQVEDGIDEFFPAQKADHAILGVEQDLPAGFSLRVEAYRKDYRELRPRYESLFDPLSLVPELRWDRVRIAPDSARAEGVEWLLTRRSDGPWNGWLNYTWSRVRDEVHGADVRRSWDQTHSVGGGITWSHERLAGDARRHATTPAGPRHRSGDRRRPGSRPRSSSAAQLRALPRTSPRWTCA